MKFSTALLFSSCLSIKACLLPHERGAGNKAAKTLRHVSHAVDGIGMPIGKGDRFHGGHVAPQGLSTKDRDLGSILNIDEVVSGLKGLANAFKTVQLFDAPFKTYEGRTISGVIIGDEPHAIIQSGIHARERGGPDHVLYFISDLLTAAKRGKGIHYGNQTYTNAQVQTALSAGIVAVPLINPDGVKYDQETNSCWRKNRNPRSADGDYGWGVDLNRNFNITWDLNKYFSPEVADDVASDDPDREDFHGTSPASEPEVQDAQWIMEHFANASWFLDLHSFGPDVLFSWGDAPSQTSDPLENFANPAYDHKRGIINDSTAYGEYVEPKDYQAQADLAKRMSKAMANSGSMQYVAMESSALYPTSGVSTDYGLAGYYGHECGANRIQGLTLEFGGDSGLECSFYPTNAQYHESMRQVATGLMEFLLTAAGSDGQPKFWTC